MKPKSYVCNDKNICWYNNSIILHKEETLTIISLFLFPISFVVAAVSNSFRATQFKIKTRDVNHFNGMEIVSFLADGFSRKIEECWRFMVMILALVFFEQIQQARE